jgi:hypothetical protein
MKYIFLFFLLILLIVFLNKSKKKKEHFKNSRRYYLINIQDYMKDNMKAYEFYKFFNNDSLFTVLNLTLDETKDFFKNNHDKVILLNDNRKAHDILVPYCSKFDNNKYVFIYGDWFWTNIGFEKEFNNNIIKLICIESHEKLLNFLNINIDKKKLIPFNPWSCYDNSFISFNPNPINKILLSGRGIDNEINYYPDRFKLSKFNSNQIALKKNGKKYSKILSSEILTNKYSIYLNKYICCFGGSTYRKNYSQNKIVNTNCILLKNFEILAVGSLLLNPLTEKPYLEKIGLIENKNCMFIDMSNDKKIQEKIDFILDPKNRKFIDKVRKAGQEHGRKNLNSKKKFEELKNIILKL